MKTLKFFANAMVALTLFASCEKETGLIGISLDKTQATLEVDQTLQLVATTDPAGLNVAITWESQTPAVATVVDGLVTAVAEGTAMIVATAEGKTATCLVKVVAAGQGGGGGDTPSGNVPQGSEFYPIIMDGITSEALGAKIISDFRPDDTNKFLYVWENTYAAGTTSGLNFFGNTEGYTSLVVTQGWSGAGFNVKTPEVTELLTKIQASPSDYYFHMALKSTDNYSHCFYLFGVESAQSKFVIGKTSVYDGPVVTDFTRDGTWFEYEFSFEQYVNYLSAYDGSKPDVNLFVMLTEGVPGAALNIDAVYIYKK